MRVLHIEAGRYLYGGAKQVQYLMEGLHQQGVENLLVCLPGADIGKVSTEFAQVYELRMLGDLDFGLCGRLKKLIQLTQPDVVHVHSRRGVDIWGGLAAKKLGIPCLLSRRVDNPENKLLVKYKYALYDHVIAISEGIRQVLLSEGLAPGHVSCVRSAVDPAPYLHKVDRQAFCEEFHLPANSLVLGVVAQLIKRKGHRYLIDALPAVLARFPQVQVLFLGQGPQRDELSLLVRNRGLDKHIHFAGFREDLPQWLGGLDLLVHPADMEGLGVSLLQAAAAGVPVIASRAGGLPEAVSDQKTGLLIQPGSVVELTTAIERMLENPALRIQYGCAGRVRILEKFSVKSMVDGNLSIYKKISSKK